MLVSNGRVRDRLSGVSGHGDRDMEGAMKYLCLIYSEENVVRNLPKPELEAMMGQYLAFTESIQKSGQYLGSNRLEPTKAAATVRVRNGKASTIDGPFAETKEQLGGYYLVEARDFNEAIQLASKIPGAQVGSIEVRPIAEIPSR
jgi:hypothetical protein